MSKKGKRTTERTRPVLSGRRKTVARALAVLAFLIVLAGCINWYIAMQRPIVLTLAHPFENPTWKEGMRSELKEFGNLSKRYRAQAVETDFAGVQTIVADASASWDLAIGSSALLETPERYAIPPQALTGSLWGIYFNRSVLERAGFGPVADAPGLPGKLASGQYSLDEFRQVCVKIKTDGTVPIALGSRFGWPLAIWIQAFVAAGGSLEEAAALTREGFDPDSPVLATAIGTFDALIDEGLVEPDHASKDWPQSIQAVLAGKAAFCLVNEEFIASLKPAEQARLGYLPLPGSVSNGKVDWTIGSILYLVRNAKSRDAKGSLKLFEFLTSQGVTERLSRRIAAPFFSAGRGPTTILPSITSNTVNPVIGRIKAGISY